MYTYLGIYLLVVRQDKCVTALGCAIYTNPYCSSAGPSILFDVNKTKISLIKKQIKLLCRYSIIFQMCPATYTYIANIQKSHYTYTHSLTKDYRVILTVFVLVPDFNQTVIRTARCKQRAIRAECHMLHGGGRGGLPYTVPGFIYVICRISHTILHYYILCYTFKI